MQQSNDVHNAHDLRGTTAKSVTPRTAMWRNQLLCWYAAGSGWVPTGIDLPSSISPAALADAITTPFSGK